MHEAVLEIFPSFSLPLEGRSRHMYVDILGLVTTGVGNLCDPLPMALKMPWRRRDGSLASDIEIASDWERIKRNADDLKHRHYKHAAPLTNVRLDEQDIDKLIDTRLRENEAILRGTFDGWDEFCADAQLGILSMAWAMGAGFPQKFPSFTGAVRAGNWTEAAEQSRIRTAGNPGVIPRNVANKICFDNAATIKALGLSPAELYWPAILERSCHE
jgi:GH24 family phage-related lysozyme (muramidase)